MPKILFYLKKRRLLGKTLAFGLLFFSSVSPAPALDDKFIFPDNAPIVESESFLNLRRPLEESLDLKQSRGRLYALKQKVWSLYLLAIALAPSEEEESQSVNAKNESAAREGLRLVSQALALVAQYEGRALPVRKLDSPGKTGELAHLYLLQAYFYRKLGAKANSDASLDKALAVVQAFMSATAPAESSLESPKYYLLKKYFMRAGDLRALRLTCCLLPAGDNKKAWLENNFTKALSALENKQYALASCLLRDIKNQLAVAGNSQAFDSLSFDSFDLKMLEARVSLHSGDLKTALMCFQEGFDQVRLVPYKQRLITDECLDEAVDSFDEFSGSDAIKSAALESQRAYLEILVSLAYLSKIDHRLERAAYLFHRARSLAQTIDASAAQKATIDYDLAETLSWQENFSEAAFFMREAWQLREQELKNALEREPSLESEQDLLWLLGITCDTGNMLGRMLLSAEEGKKALAVFQSNLLLVHCLNGKGSQYSLDRNALINRLALKNYCEKFPENFCRQPALESNLELNKKLDKEMKRRLDDALQGQADVGVVTRDYDLSFAVFPSLLEIRQAAGDKAQLIAILWQMGYAYQYAGEDELAVSYYGRLIAQYPDDKPRPLADWYFARAMSLDLLGKEKEATADFKRALVLFIAHLKHEEDPEQIDRFKGTIDDIRLNLASRKRSSPQGPDYLLAEPTFYFPPKAFPLKICIDKSRAHGFSGEMATMVERAVRVWTEFVGSPLQVKMVEEPQEADILFERALSHDDIGYGSAGRTNACNSTKNKRELIKTHVRVYCLQSGFEEDRALPAMSRHVQEQFVTLFAHEMGHAFGLAHSPSGQDIMYWKANRRQLSQRDKETIRLLYREKAHPKSP